MSRIDLSFHVDVGGFVLDVSCRLPGRGVTAVFGPSGSGKTTLLRCIAGLERPTRGSLIVNGERWQDSAAGTFLPAHRRPLGYVFQEGNLFSHLTVRGNLLYGMRRSRGRALARDLDQVVASFGIRALLDRRPERLSGGERQRVAVARALLSAPRLLLLDEPLANLDEQSRTDIFPYLDRLHRDLSIPVLYVSHARSEVVRLADHVVLLEAGRVRATGSLNEISTRIDLPFGADAETGVVLEGRVQGFDEEFGLTRLTIPGGSLCLPTGSATAGERIRVRVLARDISVALERPGRTSILNVLDARVVGVQDEDSVLPLVTLDAGGSVLLSRITRKSLIGLNLRPGTRVYAQIKSVALLP